MNEQLRTPQFPRTVDAFEHFAGSAATLVPGGCTGWRGTLLHIHIAEAASYEMEPLQEPSASPVAGSRAIVILVGKAHTRRSPMSAK